MRRTLQVFDSLPAVQAIENGVVVFWGDYGGHLYAIARAADVACSEDTLLQLATDLNTAFYPKWNSEDTWGIRYEQANPWHEWAQDQSACDIWLHPNLEKKQLRELITNVLNAESPRLNQED